MYGNKCGLNGVSLCALIYVKTEFNINRLRNVHTPHSSDVRLRGYEFNDGFRIVIQSGSRGGIWGETIESVERLQRVHDEIICEKNYPSRCITRLTRP